MSALDGSSKLLGAGERSQGVVSTNGGGLQAPSSETAAAWAELYDELRSHQSLASVINDPRRGSRVTRGEVASLEDFFDAMKESVEELSGAREVELLDERAEAAVGARTDELIGQVPDASDLQPYIDTFREHWDAYHRNHRNDRSKDSKLVGGPDADADGAIGGRAYRGVPPEYFQSDIKLEHHQIFKQSLQTSVERQEEFNAELTGHLDQIEMALCEHIGRAERDQLFDSLARMGEPLQADLRSTLTVVKALRGRMRSVQRAQLNHGLAVGRLARRRERMAEVLQRLDYLGHVQQSEPSIQMLLQGQDYVTALDLLESASNALDSNLKGVVSVSAGARRIEAMTRTFDRGVEVDFVHHSTEAVFCIYTAGATSRSKEEALRKQTIEEVQKELEGVRAEKLAAAKAEDFEAAGAVKRREGETLARLKELQEQEPSPLDLPGAERLRRLCMCLARRGALKATLGATLRDILLSHLKKVLKNQAHRLLKELGQAADARKKVLSSSPEEADEEGAEAAAGKPPPPPPPSGGEKPPPPPPEGVALGAAGGEDAAGADGKHGEDKGTSGMTASLCALSFEDFLTFWKQLLQDAVDVAEHLCEYSALIHGAAATPVAEAAARRESDDAGAAARAEADLALELLRLFEVVMDSLLKKTGVLLQARQGDHKSLKVPEWQFLLSFTNESLDKVKNLQDHCRQRLCTTETYAGSDVLAGVRSILYAQTKTIIEESHQKHVAQMTLVVEQERWERTDVPAPYKAILEQLVGKDHQLEAPTADQTGVESYLQVDGTRFFAVPAVLTLIQLLNEYVRLCRAFDSMAAEIVQRMCTLLRLFNQKTFEAILRGHAVQRQNLRKITASNIALCSQCCGLVAQVLPGLQANLMSITESSPGHSSASAARSAVTLLVGDLAKVATEYNDHRTALFSKLSDLLRERYEVHSKKWLSSLHPEATEEDKDPLGLKPHEALEGLVKDITSMYRVLLKNLTADIVRKIFTKAFEEIAVKFDQRMAQEMIASTPPYEAKVGRSLGDRLAIDVAYLQDQLDKLSGISTPLRALLAELIRSLQGTLPASEPAKAMHPAALEALQNAGRLPR